MKMQRGIERQTNYGQPSRLQLLQADFQKRQLQEKEQKLLSLQQQSQQAAEQRLGRITKNSGGKTRSEADGNVRDFFKSRQQAPQGYNNTNTNFSPKQGSANANSYANRHNNQTKRVTGLPPKKNSAGRDKSNPLAPISRDSSVGRKGSRVQALTDDSRTNSVPSLNNKPKLKNINTGPFSDGNYSGLSDSGLHHEERTASKNQKLKQSHRRRVSNQKHQFKNYNEESSDEEEKIKPKKQEKLTDFQKWQLEQDEARSRRLEKARAAEKTKTPSINFEDEEEADEAGSDSEEDQFVAEIARKERELMAQIEKRQRELEEMQLDKQREEEEEAAYEEERKKQALAHKREKAKLKAEEERREREAYEEALQEEAEESLRKAEDDRRKAEMDDQRQRQNSCRRHTPPDAFPTKPVAVKHKAKPPSVPKPEKSRKRVTMPPDDPEEDYPKAPENPSEFYVQKLAEFEDEQQVNLDLRPCPNCGRKFNADRLQKHAKACKNITKKRKVMDPRKMRMEGTDAAKYVNQVDKKPVKQRNKVDFRKQHKEFIDSIRYAKKCATIEAQGGSVMDLPPPPKSENPDYKQCPYCKRKFNPDTADRHIPKCKDIKARPAPPKKKR